MYYVAKLSNCSVSKLTNKLDTSKDILSEYSFNDSVEKLSNRKEDKVAP